MTKTRTQIALGTTFIFSIMGYSTSGIAGALAMLSVIVLVLNYVLAMAAMSQRYGGGSTGRYGTDGGWGASGVGLDEATDADCGWGGWGGDWGDGDCDWD